MDVFTLRDQVLDDYQAYIRSFLNVRDPDIAALVERELGGGHLWPRPLLQINPAFEFGDSLEDLVVDDVLHPVCQRVFRNKPEPTIDHGLLRFYRHQVDGIRAGRAGDSFVLTTGTGSGKSLSYIVPIVDHVLRQRESAGERKIQAIIVYPMNALANSQERELEKFLKHGFPDGAPVTFRCYTGQESQDSRKQILDDPPDILLTNFVMLELILTRHGERRLIDAARGLRFLVLDELHTYRGRQGADVALLVRRVREACQARDLVCIGTSATLASSTTWREQQNRVADVASLIFGAPVDPRRVIGELLRRRTPLLDLDDDSIRQRLRVRVSAGPSPHLDADDPLASWIETALGLDLSSDGRLVRRTPRTLDAVATELAHDIELPVDLCARTIAAALLAGNTDGRPFFALRVHQFLSKGDTVYAPLKAEGQRQPTLHAQEFVPGSGGCERLYPLVFCRECGQEYYAVVRRSTDQGYFYGSYRRDFTDNPDAEIGYLYLNTRDPWPDHPDDLPRLPDTWVESKDGKLRLRRERRDDVPRPCFVAPDGREAHGDLRVHFLPAPFRFCLHCGVHPSLTHPPRAPGAPTWPLPPRPSEVVVDFTATPDELAASTAVKPAKPRKRSDPAPEQGFQLKNPPNTPQLGLSFAEAPSSPPSAAPGFRLTAESPQVGLGVAAPPKPTPTAPSSTTSPGPDEPPLLRTLREGGGWSARPDVLAVVRALLKATTPRSKDEIVTAAAIDAKSWPSIIKLLVENGLVVAQGKLRATRYTLAPQPQ